MTAFLPSDDLQSLLDSSLDSGAAGAAGSAAAAVQKQSYAQLVAFRNVTSYSMQNELHACPRLFQFMKLRADRSLSDLVTTEDSSSVTFAFGHAVGAGVAVWDQTHDLQQSLFAAFLAWDIDLLADQEHIPGKKRKLESFAHACWALMQYPNFCDEETDLSEYEVVQLEATVGVDFENGHYYIGHVDELLRSKYSSRLKVKENKTSGFASIDPALYSNSDQALSYSLIVDAHGASEYEVLYTVYSKPEQRWIAMNFVKNSHAKLEWLQGQALISSDIELYEEGNFFPKRGGSCLRFNRRCYLYEECDLNPDRLFGKKFSELRTCNGREDLEAVEKIDYWVTWSDIVKSQTAGLQTGIGIGTGTGNNYD